MRFIIDTNLLVSIIIKPASLPEKALATAKQKGRLCFSESTRKEVVQVLMRNKFDRYLPPKERLEKLEAILSQSDFFLTEGYDVDVCRDPEDNKFLDLALAAKVTCIITGDRDLLELHPFNGIPIISATDFLSRFQ